MLLLLKSALRNLILPPAGPLLVMAVGFFLLRRRPILARACLVFGIGGLWLAYFCHNLKSRPLLAVNAPQTLRLFEERSHH